MKFSPKALSLFFQSTISVIVPAAAASSISVSSSLQDERLLEDNLLKDLSVNEKHNNSFLSNKNKNIQKEDHHALFDSAGDNFTTDVLANSVELAGNDGDSTGSNSNTNKNRSKRLTQNKISGGKRSEQLQRYLKKNGSDKKSKSKSKQSMSNVDKLKDKIDDLTNNLELLQADIGVLNCVDGGNNRERALRKQSGQINLKPHRTLKKKRANSSSNSKSSFCDDLNEEIAIVEQELAEARAALIDAYVAQILTANENLEEDKQEFADNGCNNNTNGRVLRPSECQKLAEDIQEQEDDLALLEVEALAFFQDEQDRLVAEQALLESLQTTEDCATNSITAECAQLANGIATLTLQLENLQADAEKAGLELEALDTCLINTDTCFEGKEDKVLEWCTVNCKNCCLDENGEYSANTCNFAGILKVCEGACVGKNACKNVGGTQTLANQGAIGINACTGDYSCYQLGNDEAETIYVRANSCNGNRTCAELGEKFAESITIGADSCNNDFSCYQLGKESANTIDVGAISCNGYQTCAELGENSATTIKIGSDSCNIDFSCFRLGKESAITIDVGAESCTGNRTCTLVGAKLATSIEIDEESCNSYYSCNQLGYDKALFIDVGANSCNGNSTCNELGENSATTITIGSDSCTNDFSCYQLGKDSANRIYVEAESCTGKYACSYLGTENSDKIAVDSRSCTGFKACYALGEYAFESITVGSSACKGEMACYYLGYGKDEDDLIDITTTTISIGAGSCLGEESCDSVGIFAQTVTIADGVCLESNSCSDVSVTTGCYEIVNIDQGGLDDDSCGS